MQGFTLILAIGAIILSCGSLFSADATFVIQYKSADGIRELLVSIGQCQSLPEKPLYVVNNTPKRLSLYRSHDCRGRHDELLPGERLQTSSETMPVLLEPRR
jgi:hypothetical protein